MDKKTAKELLSFHSSRNSDVHNPKWSGGFLGSFRPFRGELCEDNFIEVMECLQALKDEFENAAVDREIAGDIVSMVHLTSARAATDGLLGGNGILTEEQTKQVLVWVDLMEGCLMYLLDGDVEDAFCDYEDYRNGEYL